MLRRTNPVKVVVALLFALMCSSLQLGAEAQEPQQQPPGNSESAKGATEQKPAPPPEKLSLSDQVVHDILEPMTAGIVGQNLQQVLSAFDPQTPDYAHLREQLRAFFQMYSEIRFRYQILQVTADHGRGSGIAELEMDALPYQVMLVPPRRSVRMHFQMQSTPKGWRITSFTPADFFSLEFSSNNAAQ